MQYTHAYRDERERGRGRGEGGRRQEKILKSGEKGERVGARKTEKGREGVEEKTKDEGRMKMGRRAWPEILKKKEDKKVG